MRIVVDFSGESSASIVSILLPTALRRSYITPHNYLIAFGLGVAIAHGSRLRSTWVAWYRDSYGGGKRVPGCGKGKCNTPGTRQRANNTACAGTAARYLHQHRPPMQRPVPSPAPQPSSDKLESNSRIRSKAAYQEPRLPCWVDVRSAQVPRQGSISSKEIQREAAAGAEK